MAFTRLTYAPKAYAFIHSRQDGLTHDVSNDIVAGSVNRLIDQPSKASLVLRNDNFKYTGRFDPKFFPMDGITIWLQKTANNPIQVFTGYIDSIPYFQAYPGQIEIKASCTLKQFLYTHFDPGIGFMDWLQSKGWYTQGQGSNITGIFSQSAFVETLTDSGGAGTDGGMGQLLREFLIDIGGYNANAITIGDIPKTLPRSMIKAYIKRVQASQSAEKSLIPALERFMTMSADQSSQDAVANLANSQLPKTIAASANINDVKELVKAIEKTNSVSKPTIAQILLAAVVISGLDKEHAGTDNDSPGFGNGYFGESPGTGEGAAAHSRTVSMTPLDQGKRFCSNYADLISTVTTPTIPPATAVGQVITDAQALQVAKVLTFKYGKEKFYSQIQEACRNQKTISVVKQIVDCLNSNRNLESVKSLNFLSAAEVAQQTLPAGSSGGTSTGGAGVTWDYIFGQVALTTAATEVDNDGQSNGAKTTIAVNEQYSSSFSSYSPPSDPIISSEFPKVGSTPFKHSEIKYYLYSRAKGTKKDINGKTIPDSVFDESNLKIGKIFVIKFNQKTCRCVYLGPSTSIPATSPVGISAAALSLVGANLSSPHQVSKIQFSLLNEYIPDYIDPGSGDTAKKRSDYLSSVINTLGMTPSTQSSPANLNVDDIDAQVYSKYYQKANNRLAEYFYIASAKSLHLADAKPGINNLILTGRDGAAGSNLLTFLQEIGILKPESTQATPYISDIVQSIPNSIAFTFDKGKTVWQATFPLGASTATLQKVAGDSSMKTADAVVKIISGDTYPSPVWNGNSVRLPASIVQDAAANSGVDAQTVTWSDLARANTASAFSTLTNFPMDIVGSAFLIGDKSLMNDVPIIQGVKQFCSGSMRRFMSLPNGMFAAFYPDQFGAFGRKPYLNIKDVEIIDFNIVLNDEPLVTHMYVNGNTIDPGAGTVDVMSQVLSVGVITIDDVFQSAEGLNFIENPSAATGLDSNNSVSNIDLSNQASPASFSQFYEGISPKARRFLETYGTRPKVKNEPLIRSPWFEFVTAYNEFTTSWSMQTATTVDLTFMPELMAGGLVRFPDHNVIMYCEAVTHVWNYSTGFETSAYLSCPSTEIVNKKDSNGNDITYKEPVPGLAIFNKVG